MYDGEGMAGWRACYHPRMAITPQGWQERYLKLRQEGERQGLTFAALGRYVAERLSPEDLRAGLRDLYITLDKETLRRQTK